MESEPESVSVNIFNPWWFNRLFQLQQIKAFALPTTHSLSQIPLFSVLQFPGAEFPFPEKRSMCVCTSVFERERLCLECLVELEHEHLKQLHLNKWSMIVILPEVNQADGNDTFVFGCLSHGFPVSLFHFLLVSNAMLIQTRSKYYVALFVY